MNSVPQKLPPATRPILYGILLASFLLTPGCGINSFNPPINETLTSYWTNEFFRQATPGNYYRVHPPASVSFERMVDQFTRHSVIFLGELHDRPTSHQVQLNVIKALRERNPHNLAIGFELFRTSDQELLEQLKALASNDPQTARNSLSRNGYPPKLLEYYSDILTYSRNEELPVLALKPTKKQVNDTSVSRVTRNNTSKDDLLTSNPYQTQFLRNQFSHHVKTGRGFNHFVAVQIAWERHMAKSIVRYMNQRTNGTRLVVLTGNFHVLYKFGLQSQLRNRSSLTSSSLVTLPKGNISARNRLELQSINSFPFPDPADFVYWMKPHR